MSALPLGKNDKYEYLTGEEILIFNQRQTNLIVSLCEKILKNKQKQLKIRGKKTS